VFTVGLDGIDLGSANIERAESLDAALDAAVLALGSTGHLAGGATTFNLRVAGAGGEAWEPAIVVAAAPHRVAADGVHADDAAAVLHQDLRAAAAGGRGMAVVTDMAVASAPDDGSWRLVFADGHHVLEPLGLRVQPVGLSEQDVAAVAALQPSLWQRRLRRRRRLRPASRNGRCWCGCSGRCRWSRVAT
jgi:hypothetical protein